MKVSCRKASVATAWHRCRKSSEKIQQCSNNLFPCRMLPQILGATHRLPGSTMPAFRFIRLFQATKLNRPTISRRAVFGLSRGRETLEAGRSSMMQICFKSPWHACVPSIAPSTTVGSSLPSSRGLLNSHIYIVTAW